MRINSVRNFNIQNRSMQWPVNFTGQSTGVQKPSENSVEHDPENPIRKGFEQLDVLKASIVAGLGFGAKALGYIFEDTDLIDTAFEMGTKLSEKNHKNVQGSGKKLAWAVATTGAILVGIVGLVAGIYTIYNAPKSMYQGKINAHKKSEEMDIYLQSNKVEQDLYKQVGEQAKNATTVEEQQKAKQQYAKLMAAKNQAPSFVNAKLPNQLSA